MSKSLSKNQGNLRFAWQYELNGDSKFAKANGPRSQTKEHHF
jgi:hypothetical protein